jgi:Rrf2 family iron-sulfur cluster assembly transcriptional regulator
VRFTPASQYALKALLYLSRNSARGPAQVSRISESEDIPRQFLSKILQNLRRRGLVLSTRGPGGGFALAGEANGMTIAELVAAVEGEDASDSKCFLGRESCGIGPHCAFHEPWKRVRSQFTQTIGTMTLREAARGAPRSRGVKGG